MTKLIPSIPWTISRRIAVLILLFGFYGLTLHAQEGSRPEREPQPATGEPANTGSTTRQTTTPTTTPDRSSFDSPAATRPSDPEPPASRPNFRTLDSQGDTIPLTEADTTGFVNVENMGEHSPTRAMFSSLFLPGLGQAYNKKYWKIPIVYGAVGGVGYWIYYNSGQYQEWKDIYEADGGNTSTNQRYLEAWRRQLELSILTMVAVHALQVLDAYVDAHLFYWDVNPELAIRVAPSIQQHMDLTGFQAPAYGLTCQFRLK